MEAIIVKLVGSLLTGLKLICGGIVMRVMAALGLTWVNMTYLLPNVRQWLVDQTSGMPAAAMNFMAACGIDIFIILIVSAIIARVGMRTILTSVQALDAMVQQAGG